jgi:hypothetical protein
MGFSADKHLKIDKSLGTTYLSSEPHPIKVTNTALSETTRADEIVIKTAKTGRVTAVDAVMSILVKKDASCRALIMEMRRFFTIRQKVPISRRKTPAD